MNQGDSVRSVEELAAHHASDKMLPQTSTSESREEMEQEIVQNLARELQELKGADAFALLLSTLDNIIPAITHVHLLLFPAPDSQKMHQKRPGSGHDATSSKGQASGTPGVRQRAGSGASGSNIQDALGCDDVTYSWDNTCLFRISKNSRIAVQSHHPWPLMCSAAFCCAMVTRNVLRTANYPLLGPHFMDWQNLADEGARAVAAVPVLASEVINNRPGRESVVAALTIASSAIDVLPSDATLQRIAELVAPHAQRLTYTTRRMEVERIVQRVITPLAAELSVQQGRFKRVKNACGEDVLCLDETRGLRGSRAGNAAKDSGPSAGGKDGDDSGTHATLQKGGAVRMMGVRIQEQLLGELAETTQRMDNPPPATKRGRAPDVVDHIDLNWSDFLFNLISMCIVYAYFSKAAGPHESITAVLLCMAVAAFDILLLLLRWLWADHYLNYGLVLCVFQVYRVFLLPFANTWMLWSLVKKLELHITLFMWVTQGLLLVGCYLCSIKLRAVLNVPVQLVTVCFSASTAVRCCSHPGLGLVVLGCMCGIMWMQIALSIVVPGLVMHMLESSTCRSFVPHVQARRSAFQT